MKTTVGTYRVIYGMLDDKAFAAVVPLSRRSRLREPMLYPDDRIPKYVRDSISHRLPHVAYCYLIHADRPIGNPLKKTGQAQHYLGYARNIELRHLRHIAGKGSSIMRAFSIQGIPTHIVRVWVGDRFFERKLKRQNNRVRLCPKCNSQTLKEAA